MRSLIVLLMWLFIAACEVIEPAEPADNEILDGPVEGLTSQELEQFIAGDISFNDDVFTAENGLGPLFVATSCGSCHAGDGKGHPFTTLTRFGQWDSTGNHFLDKHGPQLQNRALPGYTPEVVPAGAPFSDFTPPANTGLGYLDAVSDEDILAMSDPFDANGDGISGVPNWINLKSYLLPREGTLTQNGKYIGRFGKKANAYDLHQQTASAYNQDMGITSLYEPVDPFSGLQGNEEVLIQTIHDVVFYLKTLKAPAPRDLSDENVMTGRALFIETGCNGCHREELKTGYSPVASLSFQTFYPYTDLLLHDMGSELDDGYTEGSAASSEWRTPPLWGLGLSKDSQGGSYYLMHDGRAHSIEEAIEWHGGEGATSREAYHHLSDTQKQQLIEFLESL